MILAKVPAMLAVARPNPRFGTENLEKNAILISQTECELAFTEIISIHVLPAVVRLRTRRAAFPGEYSVRWRLFSLRLSA